MKAFKNLIFRSVAALTAAIMLMGTAVFAEDNISVTTEVTQRDLYAENKEAVDLLEYLGILPQSAKSNLSDRVTRGEFAYMLVKFCQTDGITGAVQIFEDVDESNEYFNEIWAGYSAGIIHGASDGRFYPNNFVSYEEAVKMVVCALGLNQMAELQGGYPMGYIRAAQDMDITEYVKSSDKNQMNMAVAAQIIFGALHSDGANVTYSGNGPMLSIDYEYTYLNANFDIFKENGIVTDTAMSLHYADKDGEYDGKIGIDDNIIDLADDVIGADEDILGKSVYFYYKYDDDVPNNEIIIIGERANRNSTLTLYGEDIDSIDDSRVTYWDENDSTRTANISGATVYYNDVLGGKLSNYEIKDDAVLKLVDNNADRKYDYAFLSVYDRIEVLESASFGKLEAKYSDWSLTAEESEDIDFYRDGIKIKNNFLGEWDILKFKCDRYGEILSVEVTQNEVSGSVESVDLNDKEITIDGEVYGISDEYLDVIKNKHHSAYELIKGLYATFIIDTNNVIYGVHTVDTQKKQYGYLVGMAKTGGGLDPTYQAKLMAMYGKLVYTDMPEKVKFNGSSKTPAEVKAALTASNGEFVDQLIRYELNSKDQLSVIDTAIDATAQGKDIDNFSLDYKFEWDGVSTKKNWSFNDTIRLIGDYHIPVTNPSVPTFYIPYDLSEDGYYKYTDATAGLNALAKDTDYYIYDALSYTDRYDLMYPSAIVIKERESTTTSTGTTGPYNLSAVTSSNYNYFILVDEILEEVDEDGDIVKVLYGKAVNNSYTEDFKGTFAEEVWNADRENDLGYGNMTVDDIQNGDIIRIGYSNANATYLEIDRFIVCCTGEDAREGNLFTSYNIINSDVTLSGKAPYFVLGEIVICRNHQMIVKTLDQNGKDVYYAVTIGQNDAGKLVYNLSNGSIEEAKIAMFVPGTRVAFHYGSTVNAAVILVEE